MRPHPLDNPFWTSLRTVHRALALGDDVACRYPAEFAPFVGVANHDDPEHRDDGEGHDERVAAALRHLVAPGETVLALGVLPRAPDGFRLEAFADLAQMVCDAPVEIPDGPEIVVLDDRHREDVLALTALVYPHYFRSRTMELGRYFGIYRDGRLAAMIGERLGTGFDREMSAICTHPDFLGRGYARRLTAMLVHRTQAEGRRPCLHVAQTNSRAVQLYAQLGFRLRCHLPFAALHRDGG
ncbi:MAG: GNAT family N-acetyltransferase [Xanthomonadales bacterium]|nr:GNAT family N-acetyltransferase [Xanthomonadales bacterium]